jgi:hypothetical protein
VDILRGLRYLVLCSQAPGAQVEAFLLTVYNNIGRVYIGHPAAVGMPLGVADVMTELW